MTASFTVYFALKNANDMNRQRFFALIRLKICSVKIHISMLRITYL